MSDAFTKIAEGLDVRGVQEELAAHPYFWGEMSARKLVPGSPHKDMDDIWLRFRDLEEYKNTYGADFKHLCDSHKSIWQNCSNTLCKTTKLALKVFQLSQANNLGGVLLTRLPAGGEIFPHIDSGWHAAVHRKFYCAIQNKPGATFHWQDKAFEAQDGDVFEFRNDKLHWVKNNSTFPRISMIVCVR